MTRPDHAPDEEEEQTLEDLFASLTEALEALEADGGLARLERIAREAERVHGMAVLTAGYNIAHAPPDPAFAAVAVMLHSMGAVVIEAEV